MDIMRNNTDVPQKLKKIEPPLLRGMPYWTATHYPSGNFLLLMKTVPFFLIE
jgi:hypothetical protein